MPLQSYSDIVELLGTGGAPPPGTVAGGIPGSVPFEADRLPPRRPQPRTIDEEMDRARQGYPIGTVHPLPRDELHHVAAGVERIESGGRDLPPSARGVRGPMQLSDETARDLGVDPADPEQNREGGRRYLEQLYEKYGNWPDALAAYNWGQRNFDAWERRGRPAGGMPAETQRYIPAVLTASGLAEPTGVVQAKRMGTQDDIADLLQLPVASQGGTSYREDQDLAERRRRSDSWIPDPLDLVFNPDEKAALTHSLRRGVQQVFTGTLQHGLKLVGADEINREMTNRINEFEEQFDKYTKPYPWLSTAGELVGTALGVITGGGLLGKGIEAAGALGAIPASVVGLLSKIPWWIKGIIGGGVGASSYYSKEGPDEPELNRVVAGTIGMVAGAVGIPIALGVTAAVRKMADAQVVRSFIELLRRSTGALTPSTSTFKEAAVEGITALEQRSSQMYREAGVAGRETAGFDAGELEGSIREARDETRAAGVNITPAAKAAAHDADEQMGLTRRRREEAAHAAEVKAYEARLAHWEASVPKMPGAEGASDIARNSWARRLQEEGVVPPRPVEPPPYEASPVTAAEWQAGLHALTMRWSRARDKASKTQITQMISGLYETARAEAARAGLPVKEYLSRLRRAQDNWKETLLPIKKRFGSRSAAQIAEDMTHADFYGDAVKLIESRWSDAEKMRDYVHMFRSERAKQAIADIARHRMLTAAAGGPGKAASYITAHQDTLREVLGRLDFDLAMGFAKIADRVEQNPAQRRHFMHWFSSWGNVIGLEHLLRGDVLRGVEIVGSMTGGHIMYMAFSQLVRAAPHLMPAVRRAAKLEGGNLDKAIAAIQTSWPRRGAIVARAMIQEAQEEGEP